MFTRLLGMEKAKCVTEMEAAGYTLTPWKGIGGQDDLLTAEQGVSVSFIDGKADDIMIMIKLPKLTGALLGMAAFPHAVEKGIVAGHTSESIRKGFGEPLAEGSNDMYATWLEYSFSSAYKLTLCFDEKDELLRVYYRQKDVPPLEGGVK